MLYCIFMKLHRYQHIFGPYNKYLRAEFLPHWLQYSLVYCYAVWEALKSRNILFFTATNPCCALGWIYPTSKKETLDQLPSYICPKSILIDHWQDPDHILKHIRNEGIDFPFVVKPNEWLRGMGILICRTLWDRDRLIVQERYLTTHRQRWTRIVQELSEYRQEYGIFYVRLPGQSQGMISGIVQRDFPFIVGDGRSTIEKLVHHHPRARYYYPLFARQHHDIWQKILPEWEKLQLVEIGNHNRGTTFVDNSDWLLYHWYKKLMQFPNILMASFMDVTISRQIVSRTLLPNVIVYWSLTWRIQNRHGCTILIIIFSKRVVSFYVIEDLSIR